MFDPAYFTWRFRCLNWLRASLLGGAALCFVFSVSLVSRPRATVRLLGLSAPDNSFYLWVPAVLFASLGIVYLVASSDVRRFSPIIAVAIGSHLALALALFAAAQQPGATHMIRLAGVELLLGLGHLVFWWPIRS